jgi:hypothetical protein
MSRTGRTYKRSVRLGEGDDDTEGVDAPRVKRKCVKLCPALQRALESQDKYGGVTFALVFDEESQKFMFGLVHDDEHLVRTGVQGCVVKLQAGEEVTVPSSHWPREVSESKGGGATFRMSTQSLTMRADSKAEIVNTITVPCSCDGLVCIDKETWDGLN